MESKQNPFSLYDFLGYFTPGAIFLYGCILVYAHLESGAGTLNIILEKLSFDKPQIYIPFSLTAYIIGHILSFLSSVTVEKYSIWSVGYPSKYLLKLPFKGYFDVGTEHPRLRGFLRCLVALILAPITLWDSVIGARFGFRDLYAKPLDEFLREIITFKIIKLASEHGRLKRPPAKGDSTTHDFFRYAYHYAVEHSDNHLPKMQNYVALYGFLRTLTLLSIILFWGFLLHIYLGIFSYMQAILGIVLLSLLSYVLYMAFVKFYRRFSLEALMAMAVTFEPRVKP